MRHRAVGGSRAEPPRESPAVRALSSRNLVYLLVAIGIALRLAQYLSNRSLWVDEAWLALNLVSRSFGELTKSLDFAQGAPPGFLFGEELVTRVFGFSEYALRLLPLLCGALSLGAFAWLSRRLLARKAAPLAILLFAVADGFIYYASELKPYAVDVAASVALIIAASKLVEHHVRDATAALLGVGGLVLAAFSFPAVFFIAAVTATLALAALIRRTRAPRLGVTVALSLWLCGSVAVGVFAASRLDEIRSGSTERFLGVSGSSSLAHAVNAFGTNIVAAMGFVGKAPFNQLEKLALVLVLVGIVSFIGRNPVVLSVLLLPFVFTFVASAANAYPLSERTELFLVPPIILLLVEGVAKVAQWTPSTWKAATALVLSSLVAAGPVYTAAKRMVHPREVEEIRPVLVFVRDHWRAGDTLYIHYGAQYAFLYYEECGCLRLTVRGRALWPVRELAGRHQVDQAVLSRTRALVVGRYYGSHRREAVASLRKLMGRGRVWFLYSHVANPAEASFIEHGLIGALDDMGVRLDGIDRHGAHAYLYDLK